MWTPGNAFAGRVARYSRCDSHGLGLIDRLRRGRRQAYRNRGRTRTTTTHHCDQHPHQEESKVVAELRHGPPAVRASMAQFLADAFPMRMVGCDAGPRISAFLLKTENRPAHDAPNVNCPYQMG